MSEPRPMCLPESGAGAGTAGPPAGLPAGGRPAEAGRASDGHHRRLPPREHGRALLAPRAVRRRPGRARRRTGRHRPGPGHGAAARPGRDRRRRHLRLRRGRLRDEGGPGAGCGGSAVRPPPRASRAPSCGPCGRSTRLAPPLRRGSPTRSIACNRCSSTTPAGTDAPWAAPRHHVRADREAQRGHRSRVRGAVGRGPRAHRDRRAGGLGRPPEDPGPNRRRPVVKIAIAVYDRGAPRELSRAPRPRRRPHGRSGRR